MSPAEQANAWWGELSTMLREALSGVHYVPGNEETMVLSGLTTVVGQRDG